ALPRRRRATHRHNEHNLTTNPSAPTPVTTVLPPGRGRLAAGARRLATPRSADGCRRAPGIVDADTSFPSATRTSPDRTNDLQRAESAAAASYFQRWRCLCTRHAPTAYVRPRWGGRGLPRARSQW